MAFTTRATATWGIDENVSIDKVSGSGVLTDITEHKEIVQSPEQNEVGSTIQMAVYDMHWTLSATLQVKVGTKMPSVGTVVTITGAQQPTYILTSCDKIESNMGFQKLSISGEAYKHMKNADNVKFYGGLSAE